MNASRLHVVYGQFKRFSLWPVQVPCLSFLIFRPSAFPAFSMKKRSSLSFLLCALISPVCQAEPTKTNIVLIISDDQSWTDFGFMGHPDIKTPHLDKLASESVVFKRGYVPTALCRPSLMTLVTGHYASTHGVTGNDPSPKYAQRNSQLSKDRRASLISYVNKVESLPKLLGEQGYLSHQSGKWWEGNFKNGGFTHGMTRGFPQRGGRHGDDGLRIGRTGMKPIEDFVDMAVEKKKPFFIWYAPFLPHSPHNPPRRLLEKYQKEGRPDSIAKYYAMCDWFDETCGQLVGYIDKKGIRKDTLIVYVTDNGWIQNPKGRGYAPRSKQTPYEGGVRTPIMFSQPGKLKPASRNELVSSIDLVPTMLAAAGARAPKQKLPGLNLLPHLTDERKIEREAIFGESFAHDIADIEKPEASLLFRWCIEGKWKLLLTYDGEVNRYKGTHPRKEKRPQLFDLIVDPHERKNLAGQHPEIVARLVQRIDDWYPLKERKALTEYAGLETPIQSLLGVGKEGKGNENAAQAWKQIVATGPPAIPALLAAMDKANPVSSNWLRTAVDTIADNESKAGRKLSLAPLQSFLATKQHAPEARELAFALISRVDKATAEKLVPGLLNDPAVGLRRLSVARILQQAASALKAENKDEATRLFQKALDASRDVDQIKSSASNLRKLGKAVDLPRHFGFLMDWNLIGPFDNTKRVGFDSVYPPEKEIKLKAKYKGKAGEVAWQVFKGDHSYGMVDFNKSYGKLKGVVGYAHTVFKANKARQAELRLGCKNAWKVWLNGELLFGRDEYHRGMRIDQYRLPVRLKQGENHILLKACQDEQVQKWTVEWQFQMRVCDATGTAILE